MITVLLMLLGTAQAETCASPTPARFAAEDVHILRLEDAGAVTVVPADGEAIVVEGCGPAARGHRTGAVLEIHARAADVLVRVPASLLALGVLEPAGKVSVEAPIELSIVGGEGPVDVRGARSVRVASHDGDVSVADVSGNLVIDDVQGDVSGDVAGKATVARVTGDVRVVAAQ